MIKNLSLQPYRILITVKHSSVTDRSIFSINLYKLYYGVVRCYFVSEDCDRFLGNNKNVSFICI